MIIIPLFHYTHFAFLFLYHRYMKDYHVIFCTI